MDLLAFILLSILPQPVAVEDACALVELNHYYDDDGRLVFDQVIFYDWSARESRYTVRAWRLVKRPELCPIKNQQNGCYFVVWQDGDVPQNVLRRVRADAFRETWSQTDPELIDREKLPVECRRGLTRAR